MYRHQIEPGFVRLMVIRCMAMIYVVHAIMETSVMEHTPQTGGEELFPKVGVV